jgi:hypothetical protein
MNSIISIKLNYTYIMQMDPRESPLFLDFRQTNQGKLDNIQV